MLRVLGEHGAVETGRVAREAFILGPSLTGVLARMERDGLIRRERDPEDQRRTVVEATAKGRKLVSKLSHTIEAHYAWMETSLGKEKLAQLYELLDERDRTGTAMTLTLSCRPARVYGVLLNFRARGRGLAPQMNEPPYKAPPKAPVLYIKTANTWSAARRRHRGARAACREVEVGATIAMVMQAKPAERRAGYVLMNDLSIPHASFFRPPVKFKCLDGFLGIGAGAAAPRRRSATRRASRWRCASTASCKQSVDFSQTWCATPRNCWPMSASS